MLTSLRLIGLITALAMLAGADSTARARDAARYYNPRFGFCVDQL